MNAPSVHTRGSIGRRLVAQLLIVAAVLAALLYVSVRTVADDAVEATQDSVLGAATTSVAEALRADEDGIAIDIPYSAFAFLGSISDDRIFYRVLVGGQTVTGYEDLPLPPVTPDSLAPVFYTRPFRDTEVRIAAVARSFLVERRPVPVIVLVAQTREGKAAIVASLANRAAALGLGFFGIAAVLSLLTVRTVTQPLRRLAEAVARRGPADLRPVTWATPRELAPFVAALNGFIGRLRGALATTETFIAEAAHHVRTPLATVRAQAEIALRQTHDEEVRDTLRRIMRAAEDSARSAGQLLDHATVAYRSDQKSLEPLDLAQLLGGVVRAIAPAAELKDIALEVTLPEEPVTITGDRLLVESALRNLADNAVKYTPDEGSVAIELRREGNEAVVEVRDTGRGLGGEAGADLVARFRRGTNAGDVVGSGLGLTIVAAVAEAHGGRFEIGDRKEGGACARLILPAS